MKIGEEKSGEGKEVARRASRERELERRINRTQRRNKARYIKFYFTLSWI
jgi:hypothetical protein